MIHKSSCTDSCIHTEYILNILSQMSCFIAYYKSNINKKYISLGNSYVLQDIAVS